MSKKSVRVYKKKYRCVDGPWKAAQLWLSDGTTAIVRIGEEVGRYVSEGGDSVHWKPAP
jgi:hypothetical protein